MRIPLTLATALIALGLGSATEGAPGGASVALPSIVTRATDSLSALLAARTAAAAAAVQAKNDAGAQQQQQQQQQPSQLQAQPAIGVAPPADLQTQGAQQQPTGGVQPLRPALLQPLQAQLSAIQSQAQRQINQLNGLVLNGATQLVNSPLAAHAANLTGNVQYGNMLEVLSNVGKAIQQQINSAQRIQIVAQPAAGSNVLGATGAAAGDQQLANTKKNEYQAIESPTGAINGSAPVLSQHQYHEQGEQLRQEIVRRAGQLQQVVSSSMEALKSNGDLIVRRLLEQLNNRLDQAKSKADKIINEPATNEVAIKALHTINMGLMNLNNIITNIAQRLDIANKRVV